MGAKPFSRVGIVGLGLVGASLARTCTNRGYEVWGCDLLPCHAAHCHAKGWVALIAEDLQELGDCELVIFAVSPGSVALVMDEFAQIEGWKGILTDVVSVKRPVVDACPASLRRRFVPGHPMAGAEGSGPIGSEVVGYQDAPWILTPTGCVDEACTQAVAQWVESLGSVPVLMDPDEHDAHVALLSHLPHVLASSLLSLSKGLARADVAGGSWRDLTRVGRSNPELWAQILLANSAEVSRSVGRMQGRLAQFQQALYNRDADLLSQLLRREDAGS